MPPSQQYRLETLLRGSADVWTQAGDLTDLPTLTRALREWIRSPVDFSDSTDWYAWHRAGWMLDRLLPLNEVDYFRELSLRDISHWTAYVAWTRRLRGAAREQIFEPPLPTRFDVIRGDLVGMAWSETRTDEETDDLLIGWIEPFRQRNLRPEPSLFVSDYVRRVPDRRRRLRDVRAALETLTGRDSPDWLDKAAWVALAERLVRDIAPDIAPPESELNVDFVHARTEMLRDLRDGDCADVAAMFETMLARGVHLDLAGRFWVWRHTTETREQLANHRSWRCRPDGTVYARFDRFAEIMPLDRPDEFAELLADEHSAGIYPMQAFCRWLPAEHRDFLRDHFESGDLDWAACAFTTYLHLAPAPYLRSLENRWWAPVLSTRHESILDRFLHAPDQIKPPRVIPDVQEIVWDPRKMDL